MNKFIVVCLTMVLALSAVGCDLNQDTTQSTTSNDDFDLEYWFIDGLYLKCAGADMIISDSTGPCVMSPNDNTVSFTGLTDGDRIKIKVLFIEESYPGRTTVYKVEKISDGERTDIPAEILAELAELGWIN